MHRGFVLGIAAGLLASLAVAAAQNPGPGAPRPDPNTVRMVGDRFKPLTYAEMTAAQLWSKSARRRHAQHRQLPLQQHPVSSLLLPA